MNFKSTRTVKCKLCMKEFDVGNMGKTSFDSHIGAKKHKDRLRIRESMSTLHFDNSSTEALSGSRSSNICRRQH